jgi:transposase
MRPQHPFTPHQKNAVKAALKEPHTTEEFKRIQAVHLRAEHNMPAPDIAKLLGLHVASVWKIHARFLQRGAALFTSKKHGGRHHQNLCPKQERAFLKPFHEAAKKGALVTAKDLAAAYEKHVGKPAVGSTISRLLHRHGWRKVIPRPAHPKASAAKRATYKKTSPRSCGGIWTPFPRDAGCG